MKKYDLNLEKYSIKKSVTEDELRNESGFLIYTDRVYYKRCLVPHKAYMELCIHRATLDLIELNRLYVKSLNDEEFEEAENKLKTILDELTMKGILIYEN